MNKIGLEDIKIYSYHGVLEEENIIGSYYDISIQIETDFIKSCITDDIFYTVDYSKINDIVHREMSIKSKLLENVAYRILKSVFDEVKNVDKISIRISKLAPPVNGETGKSFVEISSNKIDFYKNYII